MGQYADGDKESQPTSVATIAINSCMTLTPIYLSLLACQQLIWHLFSSYLICLISWLYFLLLAFLSPLSLCSSHVYGTVGTQLVPDGCICYLSRTSPYLPMLGQLLKINHSSNLSVIFLLMLIALLSAAACPSLPCSIYYQTRSSTSPLLFSALASNALATFLSAYVLLYCCHLPPATTHHSLPAISLPGQVLRVKGGWGWDRVGWVGGGR